MRTPWWARPLRSSRVSLSLSQAAGRELSGELRIDDRLPRYLSEGATPQSALHIITRRSTANLQRCSNAHSPKCLEVEFCELRRHGVLRSSHPVSQVVIIQVWSDPSEKRAEKEESPCRSQRYT